MAYSQFVKSRFLLTEANQTLTGSVSLGALSSGVLYSTVDVSHVSTISINGLLTSIAGLTVASQDILVGSGANTMVNLAHGSNGQYLGVTSGSLAWSTLPGALPSFGGLSLTLGDLILGATSTTVSRLAAATSGFILTAQGAGANPVWAANPSQPTSTLLTSIASNSIISQDILVGSGANAMTRLAKGSNGQFLGVVSGNLAYATPNTGAPTTSQYILKTVDGSLPNAQSLGALAAGVLTNTRVGAVGTLNVSTLLTNIDTITVAAGDLLVGSGVNTMGALSISGAPSGYLLTSTGLGPSWMPPAGASGNLTATYWTSDNSNTTGLTHYVNLGSIFTSPGLMKVTTSGGTATPSIASAGTDYYSPTHPITLGGGAANARVFIGSGVGGSSSGTNLVFIGDGTGTSSNSKNNITLLGVTAGNTNTGGAVTAIGAGALSANTADAVVGIGVLTGAANTGTNNVFIGNSSAQGANGRFNVVVGDSSGTNLNSASDYNTHIGSITGTARTAYLATTLVGAGADTISSGLSNATAIGYGAIVADNNQVQLGNACSVAFSEPASNPASPASNTFLIYKNNTFNKLPAITGPASNPMSSGSIMIVSNTNVGHDYIPNGQSMVVVSSNAMTGIGGARIFITLESGLVVGGLPPILTATSGVGFTFNVYVANGTAGTDIWFNWLVINPE